MNNIIDNSKFVPPWLPDKDVILEDNIPDWTKNLIMMQCRFATATPEGTIKSAVKVLDHCREMGVNCLWVSPVSDRGIDGNGYTSNGPHTVDPKISGMDDYEKGWRVFKEFVDEAHKRDIRILLDIVSWGTLKTAPLVTEHPDWFEGEAWGGYAFNWKNLDMKYWFIDLIVDIAIKTGIDGIRYDVEPNYSGYEVDWQIKHRLLAKGRKLLMMSELENDRMNTYDLEQNGVKREDMTLAQIYRTAEPIFLGKWNIVDCVKTGQNIGSARSKMCDIQGTYRYYTNCLSNHDYRLTVANGNRLVFGYQAIMAPFIPLWYLGEEWNNPANESLKNGSVLYANDILWEEMNKPKNREFYEDIKELIKIRRIYREIFEYFPDNHRNSNICKVESDSDLQSYARYRGNTALIVIPNNSNEEKLINVKIPFVDAEIDSCGYYYVTNLHNNDLITYGFKEDVQDISVKVKPQDLVVIKVEGIK